jgi:DNA-binding transcriptional ArsR family regulator
MAVEEPRELDVRSLRAIAHPLRFRMLGLLAAEGPSTATKLAERLGESTGSTSYHLRQLARHGFIEEDPERGTARERWWRPRHRGMRLHATSLEQDAEPGTEEAISVYLGEVLRYQVASLQGFLTNRHRWSEEWRAASTLNDYPLALTPGQLAQLVDELTEIIERYRADPADGPHAERVVVLLNAFPQREIPMGEDTPGREM